VSIDLGVLCICVWREMMTLDELQHVGSVQEKQDRSKDRTLRDSKSDGIELDVAVQTCCVQPLRYDVNQLMTFSPRPYDVRNR